MPPKFRRARTEALTGPEASTPPKNRRASAKNRRASAPLDGETPASPQGEAEDNQQENDKPPMNPASIDELCISLAKANFAGGSRLSNEDNKEYMRQVQIRMLTNIVVHFADEGDMYHAEDFMRKLNAGAGFQPEIKAVNALIRNYMAAGDERTAEEWFRKAVNPSLYAEMGDIKPDHGTFYYIISSSAQKGLIANCENYMRRMEEFDLLPTLPIYGHLIRGCIRLGAPTSKRGHHWGEQMVAKGCKECPGPLTVEVLKAERHYQETTLISRWQLHRFDAIVKDLAKGLADSGYALSANKWLGLLVESGLPPSSDPELWEHVRSLHPQEIIPTLLSGEMGALYSHDPGPRRGAPSFAVPSRLSGEEMKEVKLPRPRPQKEAEEKALSTAVADIPGIKQLSNAIADGEAAGLSELELRKYKAALSVQEREHGARLLLQEALQDENDRDLARISEAVNAGEAAGLPEEELQPGREILERADKQAKARERLEEAFRKREETLALPRLGTRELPEMRSTWATPWRPRQGSSRQSSAHQTPRQMAASTSTGWRNRQDAIQTPRLLEDQRFSPRSHSVKKAGYMKNARILYL